MPETKTEVTKDLDRWAEVFARIVENVPREEGYEGTFKRVPHTWFYEAMTAGKHPLADKVNKLCNFRQPCGECKRDVRMAAVARAQEKGLIKVFAARERVKVVDGKKVVKKGYVKYFSKNETAPEASQSMPDDIKAKVLADL